jgi:hypothetical protein
MKMDVRKRLEQIRRGKKTTNKPAPKGGINKSKSNVKDLRQIIVKKTMDKIPYTKDLRETHKKLVRRKTSSTTTAPPTVDRNDIRPMTTRATKRTASHVQIITQRPHQQQPQQQYYVPPPMRRNQSTFILAPPVVPQKSSVTNTPAEHHGGASVLISNLNPTITQSDIIELYGEVGVLTAVNMINQTTALVTYQNSSDAFRAVKVYHNRLLDGRPMLVNMMPTAV